MDLIKKEQAGGRRVAMTGDGANDAPALSPSCVSTGRGITASRAPVKKVGVAADAQCQFYLANHANSNETQGVALHLDAPADSSGTCALNAANLILTVGDGAASHRASVNFPWQTGVVYTATAAITQASPQQLSLNGQSPADRFLQGRCICSGQARNASTTGTGGERRLIPPGLPHKVPPSAPGSQSP